MIHGELKPGNIFIDAANGNARTAGLRQLTSLATNGEYKKAMFALLGNNIAYAAPEVMSQVGT